MEMSQVQEKLKLHFEKQCITLLIEAYYSSIKVDNDFSKLNENDFTETLDKYIDNNAKRLTWEINCVTERHLHTKNGIKHKGDADKERRIDMKMSKFHSQKEFHFYIEAKRLREHDNALNKRYIRTGIDYYIQNIYPKGILVGYLQEGDVDNTIQGINDILNQSNRATESLFRKEHPIHNEYFESDHPNYGIIQHFVLNYTV